MHRDLFAARTLAWRLVVRDLSAQYRQTILGYLWAVLPVVVMTLIWVALNRSNVVHVTTGSVPYPVYALTGMVFWQLFLDALNAPLLQLNTNRTMLNRVNFPVEALLMSGIAQVLFSFAIKLVVLAVALVAFQVPVEWTAAFVWAPAFGILMVGTVLGVLLAPFGLLYKDVPQALLVIVSPLMLLTPVVYPPPAQGLIGTVMRWNPLTPLFVVMRDLLYGKVGAYVPGFALVCGATLAVAGLGWLVFRLAMPLLVERIEA